jgi:predicted O-linked N-acetylglucosamine transferase (SPINDLY family)
VENAKVFDGVIKSLTDAVKDLKGEDLDQLQAAINSLKAMRIKLYGTEEVKEASLEPTVEEVVVKTAEVVVEKAESPEVSALANVIKQLKDIAEAVNAQSTKVDEQAKASKEALEQVTVIKGDITKSLESVTELVSKIPLRKGQEPEPEEARIEKSLLKKLEEDVGADKYKHMHPGEKLYAVINQKLNK